ncbi:MAG: hypothetical protein LBV06_05450 [Propionibacteriaceae bacterium]|nr:hypothetical protein [Propionibacteriaceae bacterium]
MADYTMSFHDTVIRARDRITVTDTSQRVVMIAQQRPGLWRTDVISEELIQPPVKPTFSPASTG